MSEEFPRLNRLTLAMSGAVVPKRHEIERAAVAFGHGVCVLAVYGAGLEQEASDGEILSCFQNGATDKDPENGIWIWEGVPVGLWSHDYEYGDEFDGWDLARGTWRPATAEELQDLVAGVSPWGSALKTEEVPSLEGTQWGSLDQYLK